MIPDTPLPRRAQTQHTGIGWRICPHPVRARVHAVPAVYAISAAREFGRGSSVRAWDSSSDVLPSDHPESEMRIHASKERGKKGRRYSVISTTEKPKTETDTTAGRLTPGEGRVDECADIEDPVRKALCRVCGVPVMGAAPFCQDHEPPVP